MSFSGQIDRASRGLLDFIVSLPKAFSPSEELTDPEATASARDQYRRRYRGARSNAIQRGARWYEMDAIARTEANDQHMSDLLNEFSAARRAAQPTVPLLRPYHRASSPLDRARANPTNNTRKPVDLIGGKLFRPRWLVEADAQERR